MPKWLLFSLMAALSWGAWGVISKMAADTVPPLMNQVICTLGLLPTALLSMCAAGRFAGANHRRGLACGFIAGLFGALGNLALFTSMSRGGMAAVVFPLTALYPLITVSVAWLCLKEKLGWIQAAGIGLALAGLVLLNMEDNSFSTPATWWKAFSVAPWTAWALAALGLFGLTAIFQKLATNHVSAELTFLSFSVAFVPVAAVILLTERFKWNLAPLTWLLAIGSGALNGIGVLASLAAYRHGGKASVVTPLAALYPVITVLLAVPLLGERIGWRELIGIVFALAAGWTLSNERAAESTAEVKPASQSAASGNPEPP